MSFSANIKVRGYPYDEREIFLTTDHKGRRLNDVFWAGEQVQMQPNPIKGWPGQDVVYAFTAHHDDEAVKVALTMDAATAECDPENPPLALCRAAQFLVHDDEEYELISRREFPLFDLDDAHGIDRITSEMWQWHADTFGEGPKSKLGRAQQKARKTRQALEQGLEQSPAPGKARKMRV